MSLDRYAKELWAYAQDLGYDRVDSVTPVTEATCGGLFGIPASFWREFVEERELILTFWSTRRPGMAARVVLKKPVDDGVFDEGRAEGDRKFLTEMIGTEKSIDHGEHGERKCRESS